MIRPATALLSALAAYLLSAPAAAGETEDPPSAAPAADSAQEPAPTPPAASAPAPTKASDSAATSASVSATTDAAVTREPVPPPASVSSPAPAWARGWQTEVHGYFRAPVAMGIAPRPSPDNMTGPRKTQISYGPNRTVDASYFSFAYTRLQEQDWAELFFHEKHKHAEAVVGWMGYWFQGVSFRNPDAGWGPAVAYLTLDTDLPLGPVTPNVALTAGAFWPAFGAFPKYDTFTLGRFRQMGEQLKLTVPVNDVTFTLFQGFGTGRDGSFNYGAPPFYGAIVGLDLLHYEHFSVAYKKYAELGFHFSNQWTADPNLVQQSVVGPKSYGAASRAHLMIAGLELNVNAPYAGHLWLSPSLIHLRNPWALAKTGTEVMHSLGGDGLAGNYLGWANSPENSTGSGSMFNFGFLYENSLSNVQGKERGSVLPDVTLSLFGLMTNAKMDLPPGSLLAQPAINQTRIKQAKYGADLTLQALSWLGFMIRGDTVNYDLDHPALIFAAATGRVILSSHFLSSESIYLQYTRYVYGEKMVLNAQWPWTHPLVAGSDVLQQGPYSGHKPDQDVVKLQAEVAF